MCFVFEVQKLFVLGGSRRVRRKKEIKAEIVTKERDPEGGWWLSWSGSTGQLMT